MLLNLTWLIPGLPIIASLFLAVLLLSFSKTMNRLTKPVSYLIIISLAFSEIINFALFKNNISGDDFLFGSNIELVLDLPALLFAGAYITGGIVGYDSDIKSGGVGARILGIQANKQYRQDIVTIILRLVNVQTGEVVMTTTVEKTIFSTSTGSDVFKYFDADTILVEIQAGYAKNEPVTFAVRKAIEKGVVDLIHLGADKELWKFSADVVEVPEIKDYVDITTKNEETSIEVLTETEKDLVQENDNKEWNDLETEEVKDENNDETIDTSNVHTN